MKEKPQPEPLYPRHADMTEAELDRALVSAGGWIRKETRELKPRKGFSYEDEGR